MANDKVTMKDLYKQMGFHPSQIGTKGPKVDTSWKKDMLKPLSKKQYGGTYEDKLKNVFGGDISAAKDFERFMNYRNANDTITTQKANDAQNKWQNSFNANQEKQRAAELAAQKKQKQQQSKVLEPLHQKLNSLPKKKDENVMDKINNGLEWAYDHSLGPVQNAINRKLFYMTNGLTAGLFKTSAEIQKNNGMEKGPIPIVDDALKAPKNKVDKVTDKAAEFVGAAAPIGKAYQGANLVLKPIMKPLLKEGEQLAARKLLAQSIRGGTAMGIYGTGREGLDELINPDGATFSERSKNVGMDMAYGAALDPAFHLLGTGAKAGLKAVLEPASNKAMKNMLPSNKQIEEALMNVAKQHNAENALPIVKNKVPSFEDLLPPIKPKSTPKPDIPKIGKPIDLPPVTDEGLSLSDRLNMVGKPERALPDMSHGKPVITPPEPKYNVYGVEVPKGELIDTAPPEYWQKRYEEFAKFVKDSGYNSNNLSHESINELWTHFAKPDEPPLHTVIDLAYTGYKEPKVIDANQVWDKMGNRETASKNAQNIILGNKKPKAPDLVPNATTQQTKPLPNLNQELKTEPPVKPLETQPQAEPTLNTNTEQSPVNVLEPKGKPVELPPKQQGERSFFNTVQNPEKLSPELKQKLDEFDKTYKPMSNQELVDYANKYVENDIEKAFQFVKNAKKYDPRHITVGHRLIDELQKAGQYDRALDVVERLAEQGTKAGQSIQSYSIYNRLTPEGQLLRVQRHINRINENITDPAKQTKLSEQNIQDITHSADSIRRFTGQMEQANDVMKIMDNIKKGNQPTDAELEVVRSFVSDAKKFVSDLEPGAPPKAPKVPKDVRTRDKVVDFMSKREEVARQRLRERMNRANSLPVDVFYDLSIIGASKIAKGTVKLADFTEELAKEFGETVRPYAKQIYNKAVETFNLQSESMTRQRLSEVEKITNKALKNKNLDADQADAIREFARQVGQMSGDAKLESSMELQSILSALERPTFGQKLATAQTIAQLHNSKTIGRNVIGNELFYRIEQINKLLATPVDIIRSKITGEERTITFVTNNQGQFWRNFLVGAKAGWRGVNPMGLQSAYDIGPRVFRSKFNPLTYMEKSLGATLRSFDHAAYMRAYNNTIGEMATLRAVNEGLKGEAKKGAIARYIREADENMIQIADQYGKYVTFQDNTVLSTALQKGKRMLNFNKGFGLGDLIIKYPKTPGNLIMRALEYSPAGVVRSAYLLKGIGKSGNPQLTREATLAFTRAIIGTGGFSILGYFLADKGILTANGNSDYEIANLEKMAGKQANSVNITALNRFITSGFNPDEANIKKGDTFISYDWAQPLSIAVALGTGVSQSQKENGKLGLVDSAKGAFDSSANTVIQSSVLKGLNDFLANYPGRTMSDRFSDVAKGLPASFVPTFSNQARQLNSNDARGTYDPSFANETLNRAMNRIPGLDKKLPPAYDTLGKQRETYQGGSNNLLNVLLNPSFVSRYNPSEEAQFVLDYINQTGDKTAAPRMADKKLDKIPLTGEQYSRLQKIQGEETLKGLKKILPSLKESNDTEAIGKEIYKILNAAGKTARGTLRNELVSDSQFKEAANKYGLDRDTVLHRINVQGWTINKALTTPK